MPGPDVDSEGAAGHHTDRAPRHQTDRHTHRQHTMFFISAPMLDNLSYVDYHEKF